MATARRTDLENRAQGMFNQALLARIERAGQRLKQTLQPDDQPKRQGGPNLQGRDRARRSLQMRTASLARHATTARSWDPQDLALFAAELSGLVEATELIGETAARFSSAEIVVDRDDAADRGDAPTAEECRQGYDNCINSECAPEDADSFVCVCCIPCSLQYIGCIADMLTSQG